MKSALQKYPEILKDLDHQVLALESAAAHFIQPHFMSCYDRAGQNDTKGSSLFKPNSSVLAIIAD